MIKKLFNLSIISLVCLLCGGLSVEAEAFKDGDKMYVLEEREIDCSIEKLYFIDVDKDNNLVFEGNQQYEYYKVGKDNKCVAMTNQEKLDFLNSGYVYYDVISDGETEEELEYKIVKFNDSGYLTMGYIKTTDTEIINDKQYYTEKDLNHYEFDLVLELKEEDLNTYYEYVNLELPKDDEIDEELTYYQYADGNLYEKVENPISENILDYYLITDSQNNSSEEEILTLDKEVIETLEESYSHFYVMKNKEKDEFYIMAGIEHEDSEGYYVTYDVYDINGNSLGNFKDIDEMDTYHNSLFGVIIDNKIKIYNSEFKLLYENEELGYLYEMSYDNNTHFMVSWNSETYEEKYYNMYVYELLEGSNQTYKNDNLTFRFSGELDKLEKVLVNDKELDKDNYILESGSIIVTLKKDYLDSLKDGNYTLKLVYNDDGEVSTAFTILDNPQTFDGISMYFIIGFISLIGVIGAVVYFKRSAKN